VRLQRDTFGAQLGANTYMTELTNFTQPDVSPTYFIDFLEFLDNHDEIKRVRAEYNKRMNLVIGDKVLDLG